MLLQQTIGLADVGGQRKEAIALVARAIRSGIFNDLGSGSNVDVALITKSGTEMLRNYETPVSRLSLRSPHLSCIRRLYLTLTRCRTNEG